MEPSDAAPGFLPALIDAGKGVTFTMLGTTMRLIASGAETGGRYTVLEQVTPAGWGPPRHIHSREDEIFYILEGSYEVHCGDERRTVSAGACAILPRGVPHGFSYYRDGARSLDFRNYSQRTGELFHRHFKVWATAAKPSRPCQTRGALRTDFTPARPLDMTLQTIDPHINPSDEIIRLGPLAVRFLITGENSSGSIATFEVIVPGAQRLVVPAHSHDHYEETIYGIEGVLTWTVDGKQINGASSIVAQRFN